MPALVTARDMEIFAALEKHPLTALQLLKLSHTFNQSFTDERRVRERLQALVTSKLVRQFRYVIAGPGAPSYYLLSPEGFALRRGWNAPAPSKRSFHELTASRQFHAFSLADFLVHYQVAAHAHGHTFMDFEREHACRLQIGDDSIFPDAGFRMQLDRGVVFRYYVELDNSTERVRSTSVPDTWQRKLQLYERYAVAGGERFRVLIVTTRSQERLEHLLSFADELSGNKQRSLFCGTYLPTFLAASSPLDDACFLDSHLRPVPLLTSLKYPSAARRDNDGLPTPQSASSGYHSRLAVALVPVG